VTSNLSTKIPYPWHQPIWQRLQQQISVNKVPHAIMLSGQEGIGKWHFAEALSNALLCLSPKAELACGQCRSCKLLESGTHPDKQLFIPEDEGKPIKIDQIRQLSNFVSQTSQQGGRKVVLLGPVEKLNVNAANALLKNLEEPAGDTVMLLVSHVPSAVMATIRSRCQLMMMSTPEKQQALQWLSDLHIDSAEALLALAGGAPLIAKEMVDGDYLEHLQSFIGVLSDISQHAPSRQSANIQHASAWLAINIDHIIEWWLQIIHNILLHKLAALDGSPVKGSIESPNNQDVSHDGGDKAATISQNFAQLANIGCRLNKQWLFKFSDKLILLKKQQLQGANPNSQ